MGEDGAAPPPMGGLGNFKGVMLCNRPTDDATARRPGGQDGSDPPFRSAVNSNYGEQLGLPPCKKFEPSVKTRGPSAALRRHVRWLRELQDQMREERAQAEAEDHHAAETRQRVKAACEKQREAVRQMIYDRDHGQEPNPAVFERYVTKTSQAKEKEKKSGAKPLWAMTEGEKEEFEDQETSDLINFAENLDYDKFVSDLEFRQGMEALRDRCGKIQREQDAFKDALVKDFNAKCDEDEAQSTCAGSLEDGIDGNGLMGDLRSEYSVASSKRKEERRSADGRQDWDNSTNCGDERPEVAPEVRNAAERILESAPQMRAIHSKGSVQRIIEKARDKHLQPEDLPDLPEHMRRDGPVAAPVIVASEDTQTRLNRPVEPSQLPYLYRSPAV